jgi:long-chain acyl-CoA synthetase
MLTHGNIVANLQQAHAWISPYVKEGEEIITALPLYHIFADRELPDLLQDRRQQPADHQPRDIPALWPNGQVSVHRDHRREYPVQRAAQQSRVREARFFLAQGGPGGGMAVQQAVAERWKKVTGKTLAEAYGLTETSPAVCINPLDLPEFNHSIGLPISSTDVSLRDDDGYEVRSACRRAVRERPQVMKGYYNRPEDTARTFTHDGYLRTGDVATIDRQGFVRIVDRKKDMILVSGFNVYPNEVEDVVASHPG